MDVSRRVQRSRRLLHDRPLNDSRFEIFKYSVPDPEGRTLIKLQQVWVKLGR